MKKTLLILSLVLLLTGCSQKAAVPTETEAPTETAASTTAVTETAAATEVTEATAAETTEAAVSEPEEETLELSYAAYQVVYNILAEGGEESAAFQGIGPDGSLCWTYETESYPAAQLDRISPIGRFEGTYYLVEDGTVVGLDVTNGEVLFKNADFQGSPAKEATIIDDYGYLYLAGHDGPDFFAMDSKGNTVKKIETLSQDYRQPMRMEQKDNQLVIYMETDSKGNPGDFPCTVEMDWLPQAQG